jgi:hypothetical protein
MFAPEEIKEPKKKNKKVKSWQRRKQT